MWLGTEQASQGMITAPRLQELQECLENVSGTEWDFWGVCAGPGLHDSCGSDSGYSVMVILQTVQLLTLRGLYVQGFGDGAHMSFKIFGICLVYFSVSVLFLTTLRHKNWT